MFTLLICGSREVRDYNFVYDKLDFLLSNKDLKDVLIINGGQKSYDESLGIYYGSDYFASCYAQQRDIEYNVYKADWDKHGKSAGPIRNKQMIVEGKPDACVAFFSKGATNRGTRNMVMLTEKYKILTKMFEI